MKKHFLISTFLFLILGCSSIEDSIEPSTEKKYYVKKNTTEIGGDIQVFEYRFDLNFRPIEFFKNNSSYFKIIYSNARVDKIISSYDNSYFSIFEYENNKLTNIKSYENNSHFKNTSYTYDQYNRVKKIEECNISSDLCEKYEFEYNLLGNITKWKSLSGISNNYEINWELNNLSFDVMKHPFLNFDDDFKLYLLINNNSVNINNVIKNKRAEETNKYIYEYNEDGYPIKVQRYNVDNTLISTDFIEYEIQE